MKVLKFGAVWCPGCVVMKPRWKEIETELPWLETEYRDFDSDKKAVSDYNILSLPTFIFLDKNGAEFERLTGEIEKQKLLDIVSQNKDR
ncbi:MAG TPA: thioredoxin family protein [Candidatus Paceibacterota bacterium]|nr:thioredoxin family protein [Candidatus Pacearchaeota archaeon]HRZ50611.1 thioredoxin family protein [Candidatus Paceibacterota bacterium]HSA36492.1 thioredoxin family protein [Candidatus Paceibacterota bacterium]